MNTWLKIAVYADLHGVLPNPIDCDLAIIAGDICPEGRELHQLIWLEHKFIPWLDNFPKGIWTAGNHDYICESSPYLIDQLSEKHTYLSDEYTTLVLTFWTLRFYG